MILEKLKSLGRRIQFWYNFLKNVFQNEEPLFIDSLYTKGVEDFAFVGRKDEDLFVSSKHYRKGWADFELYEKKVRPQGKDENLFFLEQYITGVSCAYVYGKLFYKKVAKNITDPSRTPFFGKPSEHMEAGYKNAMAIMNKQGELLKTDTRTQRIKEIHEQLENKQSQISSVRKVGNLLERLGR